MYPIILTAMLYVLFQPFFINGQEITLSFNTSVYEGTHDYYAHTGEDVMLTCNVTSAEARVNMAKGTHKPFEFLVRRSEPVRDLNNQMEKYSFQSNDGQYRLTIHNLEESDRSSYWCRFCEERCEDCTRPWCEDCTRPSSCSAFCRKPCQSCTQWCSSREVVRLDVKETSDNSTVPDFCDLINNTDGIFFTGNNLTLRCPKLAMNLTASNGSFKFSVDFEMENYSAIFSLLTVKSLNPKFNGTMLSCINVQKGNVSNDYCRSFPTILVFNEITVLLLGGEREVTNGENVTLTCHTYPFLTLTIQWDILDSLSNASFENISISEIDQGSQITFTGLQFLDSYSSRLTVVCNVTIGSKSSARMVSIYPRMQVVSSAQTTSLFSETSSKQVISSEEMSAAGSDIPSFSPVYVVAPVIVVIGIIAIIVLGIVYIKLRKPVSRNETDRRNGNVNQNTGHLEGNVYNTRNTQGTELGLTYHDSEVADNVAYVSYDEPVSSNETDRRNGHINQNDVHVKDNVYSTRNNQGTELGLTYHDSDVANNVAYVSYDKDSKLG